MTLNGKEVLQPLTASNCTSYGCGEWTISHRIGSSFSEYPIGERLECTIGNDNEEQWELFLFHEHMTGCRYVSASVIVYRRVDTEYNTGW